MAIKQVVIMALASSALAQMSYMTGPMDTPTPAVPATTPAEYPGASEVSSAVEMTSSAYPAVESSSVTAVPTEMASSAMSSAAYVTTETAASSMPMESSMASSMPTDMSPSAMTTMVGGMPMGTGGAMGGGMPSSANATSTSQPVPGSGALNSVSVGLFMVSVTFAALLQL